MYYTEEYLRTWSIERLERKRAFYSRALVSLDLQMDGAKASLKEIEKIISDKKLEENSADPEESSVTTNTPSLSQ